MGDPLLFFYPLDAGELGKVSLRFNPSGLRCSSFRIKTIVKIRAYVLWVLLPLMGPFLNGRAVSQQPSHASPSTAALTQAAPEFVPPHLVAAWPIEYPIRSVAAGLVLLEVSVDDNGKVADVISRRDIPSLTAAAVLGVKKWEYKAAMREGVPIWSRTTVAVMFNPTMPSSAVELAPATSEFQAPRHRYPPDPPNVLSVSPAVYPIAYTGIDLFVALSVDVEPNGSADSLKVVHGLKPLTETTEDAVKKWQFQPARYEGKPIDAPMAVAFVYRVPVVN